MKIERTLFLLLTGSIAAVACAGTDPPVVTPGSPYPRVATEAVDASAPSAPTALAAPTAPTAPPDAVATVTSLAVPPPPAPPARPAALPPLGDENENCGHNPAATWNPNRRNCSDDVAPAYDCKRLTSPAKEDCTTDDLQRRCGQMLDRSLKPKVAIAAWTCMVRNNRGDDLCEKCGFGRCKFNALMNACPDPTADADCDAVASRCSGVDKVKCGSYLSGLTPEARKRTVECVSSDCAKGFTTCLTVTNEPPAQPQPPAPPPRPPTRTPPVPPRRPPVAGPGTVAPSRPATPPAGSNLDLALESVTRALRDEGLHPIYRTTSTRGTGMTFKKGHQYGVLAATTGTHELTATVTVNLGSGSVTIATFPKERRMSGVGLTLATFVFHGERQDLTGIRVDAGGAPVEIIVFGDQYSEP